MKILALILITFMAQADASLEKMQLVALEVINSPEAEILDIVVREQGSVAKVNFEAIEAFGSDYDCEFEYDLRNEEVIKDSVFCLVD